MKKFAWIPLLALLFASCTKSNEVGQRYLIFKFKFNDSLPRLNDLGQPDTLKTYNGAVTPVINGISSGYIELMQNDTTKLGTGISFLFGAVKDSSSIDYAKSIITKDGEVFYQVPITSKVVGSYKWLRVSINYLNMQVPMKFENFTPNNINYTGYFGGTVAAFIGYKTYFDSTGYVINKQRITDVLKQTRPQGYYGVETTLGAGGFLDHIYTDTKISNATTVVNPLYITSPVPKQTGIVTGAFYKSQYLKNGTYSDEQSPLIITGKETESITVECNLSTNKSFEWSDSYKQDGYWDAQNGELIINMGIRGMRPIVK